MDKKVAFETSSFGVSKEIWAGACDFWDIDNNDGSLQFKRISPNQIQIFQYESMGQKNVFESSVFQETKMIAEFVGINQGSKISWVMNRQWINQVCVTGFCS